ncbi:MAG: polyribonucleotide nucleotidyltransferase [Thermoguttaceae bacterium]|nr:polyribonucleotide nucleotidyltransferase [Thermoguttaceae bacterium]MDW8037332.1 polyribonucleotide nucleotidyltransferase [Thermoguttaceae bacterium]
MNVRTETQIGASSLCFETGEYAKQAGGSCLVQYADTVVLIAATLGEPKLEADFFPLTCEYRERVAAAGKFPGGFMKREGRPTQRETLISRLIDRPIRPMFPKGFTQEVQVLASVLASDRQTDPDVLAMNGASVALMLSPAPFLGPIGSIRLGYIHGQFVPFPTWDQLKESQLDLVVSGTKEAVLMIEGFGREVPEELMCQAIQEAHKYIIQICQVQEQLCAQVGVQKPPFELPPPNPLYETLKEKYYQALRQAKHQPTKQARAEACEQLKQQAMQELFPDPTVADPTAVAGFACCWQELERRVVRDMILEGRRPDGRGYKDLREITCKVDVLPRVHGSALFQRGETQAMITVVLGTVRDAQKVDGLFEEYLKKFMLDYYFPPFSVGECKPIRAPGRREIGHGALAERSLKAVVPDSEKFPYTIRVLSDILESNGSSSMATVCGATLGLMAAGVPISNPVAGVSIGLVHEGPDRWVLLTDIIGDEDHYGDMDFKVAGTQNGITGIQLDLKIPGISQEIIRATLAQAREARIQILRKMLSTIPRPREDVSPWAPRILRTRIDLDKIGLLIGPGGRTVRNIQNTTGAIIDIEDDGTVTVAAPTLEGAQEAMRQIEALTANVEVGKIYYGRVIAVKDFGAFVEILPGRDGLCHISELDDKYVSNVSDICKVGDIMAVKVIAIDEQDRVKLSRRLAMAELEGRAPGSGSSGQERPGVGAGERPTHAPGHGGGPSGGHPASTHGASSHGGPERGSGPTGQRPASPRHDRDRDRNRTDRRR